MGKVLFISCTPVGRFMIEEIMKNANIKDVEVVGIVNLNAQVALNKANFDSYYDLSQKYNIDIHYCNNVNDKVTMDFIKSKNPDIIIQSGWSQFFKSELINQPKYGCIGEHPAPLPKGRGAACVNWAIITGEKSWGDTFFRMMDKYDEGVILAQKAFTIELWDDIKTIYDKVCESSRQIIRENIMNWISGDLRGYLQNDLKATYYKRRKPEDGYFSFSEAADAIFNKIRGQARPYPGAFFEVNKDGFKMKVKVWEARSGTKCSAPFGSVLSDHVDGAIEIACGNGVSIFLNRVQQDGKPEMWASDWNRDKNLLFDDRK